MVKFTIQEANRLGLKMSIKHCQYRRLSLWSMGYERRWPETNLSGQHQRFQALQNFRNNWIHLRKNIFRMLPAGGQDKSKIAFGK
jgi:hypothetical protein